MASERAQLLSHIAMDAGLAIGTAGDGWKGQNGEGGSRDGRGLCPVFRSLSISFSFLQTSAAVSKRGAMRVLNGGVGIHTRTARRWGGREEKVGEREGVGVGKRGREQDNKG